MPVQFRATEATGAEAWPSGDWWRGFNSPDLNALIDQARAQNFDIAAAIARIRQADAQVRIAGAAMLPNVTATGGASWQQVGATRTGVSGATRGGSTTTTIDVHNYSVGPLNVAYEVDFWGKNRAAEQSAASSAMFSRFDQQVVALTVVTNVANAWFTALALADRLVVAQRNLADAEQTLAVIRGRLDAGTASALDVAQQESLVAGERAIIPNLRNQLEQELIGLGILVGRPPEAITVRPGSLDYRCRCRRSLRACPPACCSVAPMWPRPRRSWSRRISTSRWRAPRSSRRSSSPARLRLRQRGAEHAVHAGRHTGLARGRVDPAAVRRRHAARPAGAGQGTLRRAAGGLSQGGGAGVHRCRGRADRLALHHRAGGIAAPGGCDGAARCRYCAGPDAGGHRGRNHGAASGDHAVRRRGHARAGAAGAVPGAAESLQGAGRRLDCSRPDRSRTSFPGLHPGLVPGGIALPVGGNVR